MLNQEKYKTTPFMLRRLSCASFDLRVVINLEQDIYIDTHHKVGCCISEIVFVLVVSLRKFALQFRTSWSGGTFYREIRGGSAWRRPYKLISIVTWVSGPSIECCNSAG
jgi:hypothetical protein